MDAGPDLDWQDGDVPVSRRYRDPYFSVQDGLAETRHVFLEGNDLPGRLRPGFCVAETGVGTGLNLLALAAVAAVPVRYVGFEQAPLDPAQMARAHAAFPVLAPLAAQLRAGWPGPEATVGLVAARIVIGDARETVPEWEGAADAWFLDGFAPARNPELWGQALLSAIAARTAPGGTLATYTAAGAVRRALAVAGFAVERRAGFGRKRHMTVARRPEGQANGSSG